MSKVWYIPTAQFSEFRSVRLLWYEKLYLQSLKIAIAFNLKIRLWNYILYEGDFSYFFTFSSVLKDNCDF